MFVRRHQSTNCRLQVAFEGTFKLPRVRKNSSVLRFSTLSSPAQPHGQRQRRLWKTGGKGQAGEGGRGQKVKAVPSPFLLQSTVRHSQRPTARGSPQTPCGDWGLLRCVPGVPSAAARVFPTSVSLSI